MEGRISDWVSSCCQTVLATHRRSRVIIITSLLLSVVLCFVRTSEVCDVVPSEVTMHSFKHGSRAVGATPAPSGVRTWNCVEVELPRKWIFSVCVCCYLTVLLQLWSSRDYASSFSFNNDINSIEPRHVQFIVSQVWKEMLGDWFLDFLKKLLQLLGLLIPYWRNENCLRWSSE